MSRPNQEPSLLGCLIPPLAVMISVIGTTLLCDHYGVEDSVTIVLAALVVPWFTTLPVMVALVALYLFLLTAAEAASALIHGTM